MKRLNLSLPELIPSALILAALMFAAAALVGGMTMSSRQALSDSAARLSVLQAEEAALLVRLPQFSPEQGLAFPEGLAWPQGDQGAVELAMQQVILTAAETAGLSLVSFGGTGPVQTGPTPALGYEAEVEGSHDAVAALLSALEEARPGLTVASLWMRQIPPPEGQSLAMINLRLTLWGFAPALEGGAEP